MQNWHYDYNKLIEKMDRFALQIANGAFSQVWTYTKTMIFAHALAIRPDDMSEEEANSLAWSQFESTFDEHEDDLNFYINFLKNSVSKKLICTNPDLTVHRGKKEEYCAGSIAQIFESIGGSVVYFGKPYKEVYSMCFNKKEKVLAIGDNLRTDIKGANNLNIDSIFITEGVHRQEIGGTTELDALLTKYEVKTNFFQKELTW